MCVGFAGGCLGLGSMGSTHAMGKIFVQANDKLAKLVPNEIKKALPV
jgi:hypothetical protein